MGKNVMSNEYTIKTEKITLVIRFKTAQVSTLDLELVGMLHMHKTANEKIQCTIIFGFYIMLDYKSLLSSFY